MPPLLLDRELGFRPVAEQVLLYWRDGWGGEVREFKKTRLLPIVVASNKKALRAYRPQAYYIGLPQSHDNVFNVDRTPLQ